MTYYAALDVSLRSVAICIIDDQGEVCLERTVPSEVTNIVACLMDFDHRVDVVGFEAGTLTQYLAHGLQSDGFDVICLEARRVDAALSAMRNKTDRNDARGIAQILRTGWYSRVHVKSLASHYVRALLSSRKAVLKKCIDLENEVRGLFKVFGIKLPASLSHGPFDARVCPSSKSLGRMSLFRNGGSGSSRFDVKPLGVDGSSGGFGWSVFDRFSPFYDGCITPEVDVGGRDVIEALVVSVVVVMIDEGADLAFEIAG